MKQCPTCKMTVDEKNECPICGATLTYEPIVDAEKEHIILNKYYWIYFGKTTWFSFLCLIVCINYSDNFLCLQGKAARCLAALFYIIEKNQ